MRELRLEGDITPPSWYERIGYVTKKSGYQPHLLAINVLADACYWYRPTEIRDEATGRIKEVKKKFRGPYLQRSYDQISAKFFKSEYQSKEAVKLLEAFGLIERIVQPYSAGGVDRLFLKLNPGRVRELTYGQWKLVAVKSGNNFIPEKTEGVGIHRGYEFIGGRSSTPQGGRSSTPYIDYSTETTHNNDIGLKFEKENDRYKQLLIKDFRVVENIARRLKLKPDQVEKVVEEFFKVQRDLAQDQWEGFAECRRHLMSWLQYYNLKTSRNGNHKKKEGGSGGGIFDQIASQAV